MVIPSSLLWGNGALLVVALLPLLTVAAAVFVTAVFVAASFFGICQVAS